MTDAINGIRANIAANDVTASGSAKAGQVSDGAAPAAAASDSVDVGQTQSLFATIGATVGAAPAIDQAKVAAIRQSLSDGTYSINPQQVAKQLLGAEQALPDGSSVSD